MDRRELFTSRRRGRGAKWRRADAQILHRRRNFALVDELTEIVIPADEKSGGATSREGRRVYRPGGWRRRSILQGRDEWRIQLSLNRP